MASKIVQKGSKMASWRLPGGLWGARGAQVPKNFIFKRFWGPLEGPFWLQKSSKNRLKFELQSSIAFDQHFGPSGGLLGRFWESFLDDFGMFSWCPSGKREFMKNRTAPTRELNFRGSGGSKIDQKSVRKQHPAGTGPQERLGRLPGAILESFWVPFGRPKRTPKRSQQPAEF